MQEPYEIIESYLAGNVRGRTQIPYGAGVHQEAICPPWRKARIAARRYPTQGAVRTDAFLQKLRHDGSRLGYRMNWAFTSTSIRTALELASNMDRVSKMGPGPRGKLNKEV